MNVNVLAPEDRTLRNLDLEPEPEPDPLPSPVAAPTSPSALLSAVGALLAVLGLGSYILWMPGALNHPAMGWDFRAYYYAAQGLTQGQDLYTAGVFDSPAYLYPPVLAFVLAPLTTFDLGTATMIWSIAQHVAILLVSGLILTLTGNPRPDWPPLLRAGLLFFLWGTSIPLRDEAYLGQVNSLIMLLLLGGFAIAQPWRERTGWGRLALGALLLGLAISIKVQPILLLGYFALRGRWRLALAGGVAFVLIQLATIPFTASTVDYWLHIFPDLTGRAEAYIDNQSLNGLLARWLLPPASMDMPLININPALWQWTNTGGVLLIFCAAGVVLLGPVLSLRREVGHALWLPGAPTIRRLYMLLEIGLLLVTINLTSYLTWPHHEIWWVWGALALLAWWATQGHVPWLGGGALGLVALIFSRSPGDWFHLVDVQQYPILAALMSGSHFYALGLLWLILALTLWDFRYWILEYRLSVLAAEW